MYDHIHTLSFSLSHTYTSCQALFYQPFPLPSPPPLPPSLTPMPHPPPSTPLPLPHTHSLSPTLSSITHPLLITLSPTSSESTTLSTFFPQIWPSEMTTLTTINLHTNQEKIELVNIYDRLLLPSVPPHSSVSVSVGSSGSSGGSGHGVMSPQSSGGSSTTRFSPGQGRFNDTSNDRCCYKYTY